MDIIACEACGSHLLFSTPSSWMQQQVEKAALVFSLKLDNGHKLLCPWIDNACDESLAQFPPTTPPVLVDELKGRLSALLQLTALPIVSSSAVDYMRSTQLEEFLRQSSVLENENSSLNVCQIECLDDEGEADAAKLYFQALKLIGLCGWEPRPLPYMVDCKDRPKHSLKEADIVISQVVDDGQNVSMSSHAAGTDETTVASEDSSSLCGQQTDPKSVVLDCRLCGANVGLWIFSTLPRPLESFRLVGFTEGNGANNTEIHDTDSENHVDKSIAIVNTTNGASSSMERLSNFNLTIAGGPPPTKQNFKATISFPVLGRNLRARLSYDSSFRDRTNKSKESIQSGPKNDSSIQMVKDREECNFSEVDQNSQGCNEKQYRSYTPTDGSLCLNHNNRENGATSTNENNEHILLEGNNVNGRGSLPEIVTHDSIMEKQTESTHGRVPEFDQRDRLPENAENGLVHSAVDDSGILQVSRTDVSCSADVSSVSHLESSNTPSYLKANGNVDIGPTSVSSEGKNPKQLPSDQLMEFDLIRQHRHFCPWIASAGNAAPGWQQTLSAVQRQKDNSHSSPTTTSSPSLIQLDDPITSVRRLFASPSAKRIRPTHGSS
ncbi:uncharacterized protein LOC120016737 isoform X2 [Tripterygium wilfordii]|nr:uncharacterized protein LOC120016737 isoform X2 [Tripterygium wilfordii]